MRRHHPYRSPHRHINILEFHSMRYEQHSRMSRNESTLSSSRALLNYRKQPINQVDVVSVVYVQPSHPATAAWSDIVNPTSG